MAPKCYSRRLLKSYDYSEFSVHKPIGKGGFGLVYKAKWKDCGLDIALKQLNITYG
ncbi:hypothetical protein C2G38_2109527 [Gigaspora rosea]|uniref:Protein kinase domain-containing protein n=1 Tax=Gigaspora rosea TaxID=44941 RepID=A0A397UJW1_9GLOM|nr:hypothetical protein C2G38_2109527 [Gigaspora rosea]